MTQGFGVICMDSANFLDFFDTKEEAEAVVADFVRADSRANLEIIEFDDEGMPA